MGGPIQLVEGLNRQNTKPSLCESSLQTAPWALGPHVPIGLLLLLLSIASSQILFWLSLQMLAKVLQLSMWVTPHPVEVWGYAVWPAEARTGSRTLNSPAAPSICRDGQMGISQRKCQGSTCDPPKESLGEDKPAHPCSGADPA